jgi:manganese/zinc/iron transport system permease protein
MGNPQLEIQIIAAVVAAACAIPGVFLVLRKMALISDAISHSILLGIVVGFFITNDLNSPWLILLAALTGVITIVMVEMIQRTKLVKEDTAIGLVFPLLFSIGVILISKNANDIHLDIDSVLIGELAFAPFDRFIFDGMDMGPKSLWIMGTILIISVTLLFLFFKELKVTTFDTGLAASIGISPMIFHYGLMSVSSVTIVGAFDAVGAILVVALMIAPAATAYLLTTNLKKMIGLSVLFGVTAAISGYWLAHYLDASISGSMTTMLGVIFLITYLFAPDKGLIASFYKHKKQKIEVSLLIFLLHLNNHRDEIEARQFIHLQEHFNWTKHYAESVVDLADKNNMIQFENDLIALTEKGENFTNLTLKYILTNKDDEIEHLKRDFFLFRG